ncbi:MAG: SurA N-terminal domain-containing protein [Deltaproteobacteria bacterium]|nr:SurA N-terminal domain-containing protein [Deltaproteobacteria bacterium]
MLINRSGKALYWALGVFILLSALGIIIWRGQYWSHYWDSDVLAVVDGQVIPRSALNEAAAIGLLPSLTTKAGLAQKEAVKGLVERLIDEELVRQAAQKSGFTVDERELKAELDALSGSLSCQSSESQASCQSRLNQARESLSTALVKQITRRAMIKKVAQVKARPAASTWRSFWNKWKENHSIGAIYKVRVLLAQKDSKVFSLLNSSQAKGDLQERAALVIETGFPAAVGGPLIINPLDRQTLSMFREASLVKRLEQASSSKGRLTKPFELGQNICVIEVLEVEKPFTAEELLLAAKKAYELELIEKAFADWLSDLKREAKININPELS